MKRTFWMVLGRGTPVYRHLSIEAAKAEAERLARQHVGEEFVVLEAIATVKKSDLQWEYHPDCEDDTSIPF